MKTTAVRRKHNSGRNVAPTAKTRCWINRNRGQNRTWHSKNKCMDDTRVQMFTSNSTRMRVNGWEGGGGIRGRYNVCWEFQMPTVGKVAGLAIQLLQLLADGRGRQKATHGATDFVQQSCSGVLGSADIIALPGGRRECQVTMGKNNKQQVKMEG